MIRYRPIAVAVLLAFATLPLAVSAQQAPAANNDQTQSNPPQNGSSTSDNSAPDQKAKRLDTIVVSGSLINDAQIETATPTYTITAQQIQARGFNSISEVLQNSVFATGAIAGGPQGSGQFAQGAQTISLYGLNPEYTLTLIDGKPITQFGQLYNGESNFDNLSNIPISMVDHIDVIPGGSSSIYGSNAIAGVVNIVTKQHMDGAEILVRTGNYQNDGGANQRIAMSFGHDYGKLNVLGSLEFDNSSPMWANQVPLIGRNPTMAPVAQVLNYGNPTNNPSGGILGTVTPPDGCSALHGLFHGTTQLAVPPAGQTGNYCGSPYAYSDSTTLQNAIRSYSGMLKLRYDVSDDVRLYSDILAGYQIQRFNPGPSFDGVAALAYPGNNIEDPNGNILAPLRIFSPEEVGGYGNWMDSQSDLMYQADIGANGTFGGSNWDWDVYYLRSGDRTLTNTASFMTAPVNAYWSSVLGPVLGVDPNTGYNIYNPVGSKFYSPITPQQYAALVQNIGGKTNTWINDTRATVSNSNLFSLPGGAASFAWLVEGGNQAWYAPVNPIINSGAVLGASGVPGGGQRQHYDSAFELNLPLLKQLTLDASARYDYLTVPGSSNNSITYRIGLEYRPFDTLLLRGNYATAFLSPDMAAIFSGPSTLINQGVVDYYLCDQQAKGQNCTENYSYNDIPTTTLPGVDLQPVTASSWTGGFVWAPLAGASLSIDYMHIAINNEVQLQDVNQLMIQDAQCLDGSLSIGSLLCQKIVGVNGQGGQVQRNAYTQQVTALTVYYVNISDEVTDSVTAEAKYAFQPTSVGKFNLQFDYNDMLKHEYQIYPGTQPIDMLNNPLYSTEFKSVVSGSLTWTSPNSNWTSTAYWHRYGSTPNYIAQVDGNNVPGAGSVAPWTTWNWSVNYSPPQIKGLDVSLMINNVMNKMPPRDPGFYTNFPYYNGSNYNPYGREFMLQADWRFGGKTGS
jgi:iron complex outermembrane receptor protein